MHQAFSFIYHQHLSYCRAGLLPQIQRTVVQSHNTRTLHRVLSTAPSIRVRVNAIILASQITLSKASRELSLTMSDVSSFADAVDGRMGTTHLQVGRD